jgi:hypothetical protein
LDRVKLGTLSVRNARPRYVRATDEHDRGHCDKELPISRFSKFVLRIGVSYNNKVTRLQIASGRCELCGFEKLFEQCFAYQLS